MAKTLKTVKKPSRNSPGTSKAAAAKVGFGQPTQKRQPSPLATVFRDIKPSWRDYIVYVDYAANEGDEDMQKVMTCFMALPKKEKREVMPERLCELAGVKPSELVGAVCAQIWAHNQAESAMAAAIAHPEVVRQTAKAARNVKWGGRDRELFFRVTGSLPDKKGTTIINNNSPQTAIVAPPQNQSQLTPGGRFLPMEESVLEMEKLIEAPTEI